MIFPGVILDNIQGMISIYGETDLSPRFLNALTYSGNNYYALAVVLMAAICALTGFSYIYSRPKLDFYHSLPISRSRLFAVDYATGALCALVPYLVLHALSIVCTCAMASVR